MIKALGFDPEDLPALFGAPDLKVSRWGTVKIDFRTMMTNLDGVFAAGDIVRGASPGGLGHPRRPRRGRASTAIFSKAIAWRGGGVDGHMRQFGGHCPADCRRRLVGGNGRARERRSSGHWHKRGD